MFLMLDNSSIMYVLLCLHCRTKAIIGKMLLNYNKQEAPLKSKRNSHCLLFLFV